MGRRILITSPQEVQLAARAIVCQRTVHRVYLGSGNEYSRQRVTAAALELGLPLPPDPSTGSSPNSPPESPPSSKAA